MQIAAPSATATTYRKTIHLAVQALVPLGHKMSRTACSLRGGRGGRGRRRAHRSRMDTQPGTWGITNIAVRATSQCALSSEMAKIGENSLPFCGVGSIAGGEGMLS